MAQLLVHLITVTLCGQDSPSPKATRVISPVNGCLSESSILWKQGWGSGDKSGLWVKTIAPHRADRTASVETPVPLF